MFKILLSLLVIAGFSAHAKPLRTFSLNLTQDTVYKNEVRVGIQEPDGLVTGDVLYIHGFGDRLDNHAPLFAEWNRAGLRVIAFDLPSHGLTRGTNLNIFTFTALAKMAAQVEAATREDSARPLILAGWSTGGLLAIRIVQADLASFSRPLAGMILFAPGVSVYSFVGQPSLRYPIGEVTNGTLTHDPAPPHRGDANPKSPGSKIVFAIDLKINSLISQYESYPKNLPTLVLRSEGDGDVYADSSVLKTWIARQNLNGANIQDVGFFGARHEIDNETDEFGGTQARRISADFARQLVLRSHVN